MSEVIPDAIVSRGSLLLTWYRATTIEDIGFQYPGGVVKHLPNGTQGYALPHGVRSIFVASDKSDDFIGLRSGFNIATESLDIDVSEFVNVVYDLRRRVREEAGDE